MTPSAILTYAKIFGVVIVMTIAATVVTNVMSMSVRISDQQQTIKRLEGKLSGAYMRIDRRDAAIMSLPDKCKAQALEWVRTGDIPSPFNPFNPDNQR